MFFHTHSDRIYNRAEEQYMHYGETKTKLPPIPRQFLSSRISGIVFDMGAVVLRGLRNVVAV